MPLSDNRQPCAHCPGLVIETEPDGDYTHTSQDGRTWTHQNRASECAVTAWCDTPEPE